MEQLNPNPMLGGPRPGGMMPSGGFLSNIAFPRPAIPTHLLNEQQERKKEFARGVFVSGFEKSVTTAMLQHHFSIKPIYGIRNPLTKIKESKGFAFIYYGSEDDALHVKKTLDRTAILKAKIRVTRTVISENLSKMIFKLNTAGKEEKEIKENEGKYFSDEQLEKEAERIIKPYFQDTVEVNKITIPHSKKDNTPLRYARVFFYVSDLKEASNIATRGLNSDSDTLATDNKNEYERILAYISQLVNQDQQFSSYAKAEIYEYTKKNQTNVLHIKGIRQNQKEDPSALADEIKEFVQKQNPQWRIANVYAAMYSDIGAWANVTFESYDDTKDAFENFKNNRPKFRDTLIYGSMRNVKDPRTVVVSVVRKDVTEKQVKKFLDDLAEGSAKKESEDGNNLRKYDYFSFNIIESKRFYKTGSDKTEGVLESDADKVHESWMEINEVPRRLIIHFFNDFDDDSVKDLTNDIKLMTNYKDIFLGDDDSKKPFRPSVQKGHLDKDGTYIKHTDLNKGKKKLKPRKGPFRGPKPGGVNVPSNLGQFSMTKGMPKVSNPGTYTRGPTGIPPIGFPAGNFGIPVSGPPGSLPGMSNPPAGFPGTGLPGTMPSNLPGMRPPAGSVPGQPPFNAPQPGSTSAPQAPLPGQQPQGFKPPGYPGASLPGVPGGPQAPGATGLPGMPGARPPAGLPGMGNVPPAPGMGLPGTVPGFPPQSNIPKPPPK